MYSEITESISELKNLSTSLPEALYSWIGPGMYANICSFTLLNNIHSD